MVKFDREREGEKDGKGERERRKERECDLSQHLQSVHGPGSIVRGRLPRTQTVSEISGDRIHKVQSCTRPGSSRIPRLGGRTNGALGNPTHRCRFRYEVNF